MPLLFNLAEIATVLAAYPEQPLMVVEGEKDVVTAGGLGVLATTNADGAGKWRVEDTRTLIGLGVRKVVVCPDNDGPGIEHGMRSPNRCSRPASRCAGWNCLSSASRKTSRTGRPSRCSPKRCSAN